MSPRQGEIIVFTQKEALWTIWSDLELGPFWAPGQGDLAQILGSEPAYDLIQSFVAQMIILFKILFFIF